MKMAPDNSSIRNYYIWLAVFWGVLSLALIVFNPIGDLLDTFQDSSFPHQCILAKLNGLHLSWWFPPPFSLQLLVVIGAPIVAVCIGLRHRWSVYVGTIVGMVYLLFTIYALLNAEERASSRPFTEFPEECYIAGVARIIGASAWVVSGIALIVQLAWRSREES